ncbi:MAG: redoxin family protein [Fidelibacterota bacterium]
MSKLIKNITYSTFLTVTLIFLTAIIMMDCNKHNIDDKEAFTPDPVILEKQEVKMLETGDNAPVFSLPDIHGKTVSIDDFDDAKILVVAFICNHCPTAQAYEDRLIAFTEEYKEKNVAVVAINPTSPYALLPEECGYSDLDDKFENMKIRAETKGYNFPYLYDGDNQAISIQYGPQATPHFFVFDDQRKLRYSGRMDGTERPGTANGEDLRLAVDQVLAGEEVTNPRTKSFGCSIKWSWKSDWTEKMNKEWQERPVTLKKTNIAGIDTLLTNTSNKLRLINIWASWCSPCVIELPELVLLQRYYGGRAFEFITLSTDKPDKFDETLKLLKEKHLPVRNFIYSGADTDQFIETIDPEWSGALPFTLLIEPGGKIVYKTQGIVHLLELKRAIVKHPMVGRYF